MWTKFWFEGNLGWGLIKSSSDWKRIKDSYKDTNLSSAKKWGGASIPYFGFAVECRGKETLGEFFKKNGMEI